MDNHKPKYLSSTVSKIFNEIVFGIIKNDPEVLKHFESYSGKIIQINFDDNDTSIQLIFDSSGPKFTACNFQTPNTILQTQWKDLPNLIFSKQLNTSIYIEGDHYLLEELRKSINTTKSDLGESIQKLIGEETIYSSAERLKLLIGIFKSIDETATAGIQESASDYFTNREHFIQLTLKLHSLRNRVDRLSAVIKQLDP